MALAGHHIRQDKSYTLLTDAILARDQVRTADLFYRMVKRDGRSVGDALGVVTAADAPFVQVPSHINFRDGHIAPSVWYGGHGLAALPPTWPGGSVANDGPVSSFGTT